MSKRMLKAAKTVGMFALCGAMYVSGASNADDGADVAGDRRIQEEQNITRETPLTREVEEVPQVTMLKEAASNNSIVSLDVCDGYYYYELSNGESVVVSEDIAAEIDF